VCAQPLLLTHTMVPPTVEDWLVTGSHLELVLAIGIVAALCVMVGIATRIALWLLPATFFVTRITSSAIRCFTTTGAISTSICSCSAYRRGFHRMERARRNLRRAAVNTNLEKISCKPKRRPYIRLHRAMLRTNGHIESMTTRLGVVVAIHPCASAQDSSPKFGTLPRILDWSSAGP
jgi:hypothetical protein